jgi:hypothetical protein
MNVNVKVVRYPREGEVNVPVARWLEAKARM